MLLKILSILLCFLLASCLSQNDKIAYTKDFYSIAQKYYEEENYDKALEYYLAAQRLSPSLKLDYSITRVYVNLQKFNAAYRIIDKYLRRNPQSVILREIKAYTLYQESLYVAQVDRIEKQEKAAKEEKKRLKEEQKKAEEANKKADLPPITTPQLEAEEPDPESTELPATETPSELAETTPPIDEASSEPAEPLPLIDPEVVAEEEKLLTDPLPQPETEEVAETDYTVMKPSQKEKRAKELKQESKDLFARILEQVPHRKIALYNLGLIEKNDGNNHEAEKLWLQILSFDPSDENTIRQLLLLYSETDNNVAIENITRQTLPFVKKESIETLIPYLYAGGHYEIALSMLKVKWKEDSSRRTEALFNFYYGSFYVLANQNNESNLKNADLYLQRAIDFGFRDKELIYSFLFAPNFRSSSRYKAYFRRANLVTAEEIQNEQKRRNESKKK